MMSSATRFAATSSASSWEYGSATSASTPPSSTGGGGGGFYGYLHSMLSPLGDVDSTTSIPSPSSYQPRTVLPTHLPLSIGPSPTSTASTNSSTPSNTEASAQSNRVYQPQQQQQTPVVQPHAHAPPQIHAAPPRRVPTFPPGISAAALANATRQLQARTNNSSINNRSVTTTNSSAAAPTMTQSSFAAANSGSSYGVYGRLKACTSCRAAHVACDSGHPACGRCISLGNSQGCVYLPARKRGRPKKNKTKKTAARGKAANRKGKASRSKKPRTDDESENDDEEEQNEEECSEENSLDRPLVAVSTALQHEVVSVLNAASRQRFQEQRAMAAAAAAASAAAYRSDFASDGATGSFSSETEEMSPMAYLQQPIVSPLVPSAGVSRESQYRPLAPRGNSLPSYDFGGKASTPPTSLLSTSSPFPFPSSGMTPSAAQRNDASLDRLESLVSTLLKEVVELKQEQRTLREEVTLLRSSPQPLLRTSVTSSEDDDALAEAGTQSPPTPLDLSCDCYFEPDATESDQTQPKPTYAKPNDVLKLSKIDKERVVPYLPKHLADILLGKVGFNDLPKLYPKIPTHDPENHSFVITDVRKPFMIIERALSPLPLNNTEAEHKFYWEKYMMPPGYDLIVSSLNQACCRLLKYGYDEIVGSSAFALLPCSADTVDYDPLWFALSPYPSSNPMPMASMRIFAKDGEQLEISGQCQVFYDEDGDAAWFAFCIDEVTNRFYPQAPASPSPSSQPVEVIDDQSRTIDNQSLTSCATTSTTITSSSSTATTATTLTTVTIDDAVDDASMTIA